jgi:probable rRNA maturation factor
MARLPSLHLYNHQKRYKPPLPWLKKIARLAVPACQHEAISPDAPIRVLEEIEITFVSDEEIARVHGEFLEDPTPTDVITFHHGEILISTDTAERQSAEHGQSLDHELALYMIHGLLHLGGLEDHEPEEAEKMALIQATILRMALLKMTQP